MLANHNDKMYPNHRCSKLERISFISFQHAPFMLAIGDSLDAVAFNHLKTYLWHRRENPIPIICFWEFSPGRSQWPATGLMFHSSRETCCILWIHFKNSLVACSSPSPHFHDILCKHQAKPMWFTKRALHHILYLMQKVRMAKKVNLTGTVILQFLQKSCNGNHCAHGTKTAAVFMSQVCMPTSW